MDATRQLQSEIDRSGIITEATIRFKQLEDSNIVNFWMQGKMLYVLRMQGVDLKAYVPLKFRTGYDRCMEFLRLFEDYVSSNLDRRDLILAAEDAPKEINDLGPDKILELIQIRREHRPTFLDGLKSEPTEITVKEFREERQKFLEENPSAGMRPESVGLRRETWANQRKLRLFGQMDDLVAEIEPVAEAISSEFLREFQMIPRYERISRAYFRIGQCFGKHEDEK